MIAAVGSYVWPIPAVTSERRALLTRAAEQEARRQTAWERGDLIATQEAERELERLWRRFGELEGG